MLISKIHRIFIKAQVERVNIGAPGLDTGRNESGVSGGRAPSSHLSYILP